MQQIKTHTKLE